MVSDGVSTLVIGALNANVADRSMERSALKSAQLIQSDQVIHLEKLDSFGDLGITSCHSPKIVMSCFSATGCRYSPFHRMERSRRSPRPRFKMCTRWTSSVIASSSPIPEWTRSLN